jgi:hypothetical protein
LIVGMKHDDDVSSGGEGEAVTGFLVTAVTAILRVNLNAHTIERPGDGGGLVTAGVIDQDDFIHDVVRDHLFIGLAQGPGGIVGRHHHDDFVSLQH